VRDRCKGENSAARAPRCLVALVLAALCAAPLLAPVPAAARDMGPGTVVGRVTDTTSRTRRRIFVQAGREKWALHLGRTSRVFHAGQRVSIHNIDLGSWVRARGRRIGRLRLQVERLDVAGDRAAYRKSQAYRASQPDGYFLPRY
jgi:hypothetical protein